MRETCDELQAQLFSRDLEKGRTLLNDHPATNSLAAEFEFMSQDDVSVTPRADNCPVYSRWRYRPLRAVFGRKTTSNRSSLSIDVFVL